MSEIPSWLIYGVGLVVISNLGLIFSLFAVFFKAGMFVSATKFGIKDAKASSVRAHKRIDELEEK